MQWLADGLNDMFADAVLAVVLRIEANPVIMNGNCHQPHPLSLSYNHTPISYNLTHLQRHQMRARRKSLGYQSNCYGS